MKPPLNLNRGHGGGQISLIGTDKKIHFVVREQFLIKLYGGPWISLIVVLHQVDFALEQTSSVIDFINGEFIAL